MQQKISTVNGVVIVTIEYNGKIYVPLKLICQALNIDVDA